MRRAVEKRADDGPALVPYIRGVLRKRGRSEGWNALLEADRLQYSFEDMVANPPDPRIAGLFSDEDRELATRLLRRKPGSARPNETVESDDTEVPAGAGSTRSSLLLLYWSKHLAATGRVEKVSPMSRRVRS